MVNLRHASVEDIALVDTLLRSLSTELGDRHVASIDSLRQSGFGAFPAFHAQLAIRSGADEPVGIALYSPLFSTTIGGAGLYLSDLWVAPEQRGTGLGLRLMAAAAGDAAERWQAEFLKLAVYDDNQAAIAFYDQLGFKASDSSEHYLVLKRDAFGNLLSTTLALENPRTKGTI